LGALADRDDGIAQIRQVTADLILLGTRIQELLARDSTSPLEASRWQLRHGDEETL